MGVVAITRVKRRVVLVAYLHRCDLTRKSIRRFRYRIFSFHYSPYPLVAKSSLHGAVQDRIWSIVVNVTALDTFDRQGVRYQQCPKNRTDEQRFVHVECASTNGLLVSYFLDAQDYISSDNVSGSPRSHGVSFDCVAVRRSVYELTAFVCRNSANYTPLLPLIEIFKNHRR